VSNECQANNPRGKYLAKEETPQPLMDAGFSAVFMVGTAGLVSVPSSLLCHLVATQRFAKLSNKFYQNIWSSNCGIGNFIPELHKSCK